MSPTPLPMTYHHPMRVCDSADFDGTNDYMTRGAGLTGAADSKTGIISAWVRLDSGNGIDRILWPASNGAELLWNAANRFQVILKNSAGTELASPSTSVYAAGVTWRHVLASWNLATPEINIYVNDALDGTQGPTDDTVDYTVADWGVGATTAAAEKLNGCIADLYFAPGQYLDFSLVVNRRKFISASGKPVHLGTTGALPTGTAPLVYHHLDDGEAVANFATNRGTGGDFAITGTLDTGSTSPSD